MNTIYSLIRHPLYVGNFLMWLGVAMLPMNLWFVVAFCLFYWVYYERIMYAEEEFLKEKFKNEYEEWSKDTPAFIPKLSGYSSNTSSFNWKKVIRQEKNGIFAIFVVFYLFDLTEDIVVKESVQIEGNYWFYALILSGIYYVVIKTLNKKTKLLDSA